MVDPVGHGGRAEEQGYRAGDEVALEAQDPGVCVEGVSEVLHDQRAQCSVGVVCAGLTQRLGVLADTRQVGRIGRGERRPQRLTARTDEQFTALARAAKQFASAGES